MKNLNIITCLLALSLAITTTARETSIDPRENLSFGLKAGINSSNVWDEEGEDFEANSRLGFAGGIFLGIPMGTFLGFQPEVLISQKGFQGSGTMFGTS